MNGGQEDLLHALLGDLGRVVRVGRDGAHAARVQPLVAVLGALVIHGRDHGNDRLAVGEGEDGDLGPLQKLLDEHLIAARAEDMLDHHVVDGRRRLFVVFHDDRALAKCQPVRLDDGGITCRPQVGKRLLGRGERLARGGGDAVLLHQILGVHLAPLDDRRVLIGAEAGHAHGLQGVHAPQNERIVGRDDGEVHILGAGEFDNTRDVRRLDGNALRVRGDAAVAGQRVDLARPSACL